MIASGSATIAGSPIATRRSAGRNVRAPATIVTASTIAIGSAIMQSLHHAPITNAWIAISAIAQAAPAIARTVRSRGRSTNASAIITAKKPRPSTGIGTPSGWAHAEARTVAQPDSAQNVGSAAT